MTRILKFLSIIFISSLLITSILGLLVRPHTYITRTLIIESPVNVVWRQLLNYHDYQVWQQDIKKAVLNSGGELSEGASIRFYHKAYENEISHEERIVTLENDNKLSFLREGLNENPLLKDFKTTYLLKRLLDGTTEISVSVSYQTEGFVTRIYNQLFLRSAYADICDKNLAALRKLIENS
jgi:hypothetical protein